MLKSMNLDMFSPVFLTLFLAGSVADATPIDLAPDPALGSRIAVAAAEVLKADDAPGASVALVRDGRIVWSSAYGLARVSPAEPSTAATRFQIASVSKEFTAAAALLLQEDGKLRLDDPISRWLPYLTEADHITLRQLLTHTAGYSDFFPQDYVTLPLQRSTTPRSIMDRWAKRPLDFRPGEDWQYSNTDYVVAGQVIQKAAEEPLFSYLRRRIFQPLGMSVGDADVTTTGPGSSYATGYERHALGPIVQASSIGSGWFYAAGEMETTATDVARWDVSLIDHSLLSPASYAEEVTTAKLTDGRDTGYALGLFVHDIGGRREWEHRGEGAGFLAENRIFPDDRVAVVVLVNSYSTSAASDLADRIQLMVLTPKGPEMEARRLFASLQRGVPPKNEMTPECAAYFDAEVTSDYARSLKPLGDPVSFLLDRHMLRGGMTLDSYRVRAGGKLLRISMLTRPDGKIDQFLIYDAE